MNRMIKSKATTIATVNGYDYEQQTIDGYGAQRDFAEIAMRIQSFNGCATDCPAYLRSGILAWLRENDAE